MDASVANYKYISPEVTARLLDGPPPEAIGPAERITPLRKAPGFTPAAQRWSYLLPPEESQFRVAFFGAQAPDKAALDAHPLHAWVRQHLEPHPASPACIEHARFRTEAGLETHVTSCYWVTQARFDSWSNDPAPETWWQSPERLQGPLGSFREILRVPRTRQESLYWLDFEIGLMKSPDVRLYPTPYCGYYGAMRDRLQAAAADPLETPATTPLAPQPGRTGFGEHWSVHPPHNLAVIRGGSSWGFMDAEQSADYEAKLRQPVTNGMDYLAQNPVPSGCASIRWQRSTDATGAEAPDEHAIGYFLSLRHLERWSEGHGSHAAIFNAAITRYKKYGAANQLRTWHEVYILPEGDQRFEYLNCHPETGLLSWFDADRLR